MGRLRHLASLRNHIAIVGAAGAFALSWLVTREAYISILVANIVFLGLFSQYDFPTLLKVPALESRCEELMATSHQIAGNAKDIRHDTASRGSAVLELRPRTLRTHSGFSEAFKFSYVADDTYKFTVSYRERVTNTFFIAFVVTFFTFVTFQTLPAQHPAVVPATATGAASIDRKPLPGAPSTQAPKDRQPEAAPEIEVSDATKIIVTIAGVLLNAVNILRLFWFYRERSSSLLKPGTTK